MLKEAEYIRLPEGGPIVMNFINAVVSVRNDELEEMLAAFRRGEGYALNDDVMCCFAAEVPESDPEYFGETGVAVYHGRPVGNELTIVLLEEHEFFALTAEVILRRQEDFAPARFEALKELLAELCEKM